MTVTEYIKIHLFLLFIEYGLCIIRSIACLKNKVGYTIV